MRSDLCGTKRAPSGSSLLAVGGVLVHAANEPSARTKAKRRVPGESFIAHVLRAMRQKLRDVDHTRSLIKLSLAATARPDCEIISPWILPVARRRARRRATRWRRRRPPWACPGL